MNLTAAEFLTRCFAPDETIALLLRRENPAGITQRIVRMERILDRRYQAWLSYENSTGANIYVVANPLLQGSCKRTKVSIAAIRHLYLDIDEDGEVRLATLWASNAVPRANIIISTSPRKYQVLWRVEGFDFEQQERALKLLALAFGGDPACTDRNRVLRIPGFFNHKYDPAFCVTAEYPCDSIWRPSDFHFDSATPNVAAIESHISGLKPLSKHSPSEEDWAWVSDQLAHGKDAAKLTQELARRRSDKNDPIYYAQRTVDVASARLWLSEGTPMGDVITMLEVRRRFEIPAAICSARAREIAATAQRMIARRKTA